MYEVVCKHCGKTFEVEFLSQQKKRKYCSVKCRASDLHSPDYLTKSPFPPIKKGERKKDYAKRCLNMNTVAAKYPNRKERRKVLEEYHQSVPPKERNQLLSQGKFLFIGEASRFLGVVPSTMKYWERKGYIIPGFIRHKGKKFRVYQLDLLKEIKRTRDEAFKEKQESERDKVDSGRN